MAMTGFICHDDYYDRLTRLTDEEVGHLFRQLMLYHAGRLDEMTDFIGMEGLAFDFIAADIDRLEEKQAEKSETNRMNGMKGGRPKKQPEANETEINPPKPTETEPKQAKPYKDKDKEIDKDKDKYLYDDVTIAREEDDAESLISSAEASEIQGDHDRVLDAAEDAGFKMSNSVRAGLITLYASHGLVKVLDGIESCVKHGAPNLAYLEACMKDTPKKPIRAVPAQQYEQRDYGGEQEAAMARMIAMGGSSNAG